MIIRPTTVHYLCSRVYDFVGRKDKTLKIHLGCLLLWIGAICGPHAATVFAQDDPPEMQVIGDPKPMYAVLPPRLRADVALPSAALPTWNGSFLYKGTDYTYNMVGTHPSTNTSTTVPVFIIPIKVESSRTLGTQYTLNPTSVLSDGKTVNRSTILSPVFDSTTTYIQGGVNVGKTQHVDAFQPSQLLEPCPGRSELSSIAGEADRSTGTNPHGSSQTWNSHVRVRYHRGSGGHQLL